MPLPLNLTSSPNGTRNLPPTQPEPPPSGRGRQEAIDAAFQAVVRQQSELASAIDQLRNAISASSREIGIGHNQGPLVQFEELDAETSHLLALLQDKGPNPSPAERADIAERSDQLPTLSERASTLSKTLATEGVKIGAREVVKNVTAPFWADVARRILELYQSIKIWLSHLI